MVERVRSFNRVVSERIGALGAALGTLGGWGIEQRAAHGAESSIAAERSRYAEAA